MAEEIDRFQKSEKRFRQSQIDEAKAIKALVTQAERLYPLYKRLEAKITELEKYLETHNEHVTRIVLDTLKEIKRN